MTSRRALASVVVVSLVAAAAACGPGASQPPRVTAAASSSAPPIAAASVAPAPSSTSARPPRRPPVAWPERAPELGIVTPRAGEPTLAAVAEARLVAAGTCEKAAAEQVEAQVKAMRAAVDASFKDWHEAQPQCWEDMREEARRNHSPTVASGGIASLGSGGGGKGAGIGLGSIGTLGHGAGTGTGAGYGAAAPRIAAAAPTVNGRAGAPATATKTSGTNVQVAGVDEPDIVKTDGKYVYIAQNGALRIAEAMQPRIVSVTKLSGTVREMFVEGDRAVVYTSAGGTPRRCTYGYDCAFGGDGTSTKVTVLELGDRAAPRVVREIALSGSLVTARRIGRAVHTVVADGDAPTPRYDSWPLDLDTCGTPEATVRAKFAKLKADNEKILRATKPSFPSMVVGGRERPLCDGLLRTAIKDGTAYTSLVSFDLARDDDAPTTATIQSRPGAVFASGSALYMSVVHKKAGAPRWYSGYPSVDEVSDIHKFRIGAAPKETRYVGSGTVPGHVLNQFAMDEWYGYLRVATTRGRVPSPNVSSDLSVLAEMPGGTLARIGAIEKIAPGEDIRSVRFEGDRGYIVTFKKTDPLFVVDLFYPARPKILGELKIPGFSTYMHRIDPEHLLSIGFDANDHGSFAYFDGVILQLFDVKNPTEPRLLHKEKIGSRGSSSEAATNHLAFNYFASEGLLAVPMTICEGGGDGRNGDKLAFSGLLVYDVDVERGFTKLGGVDHGKAGVSCSTWWSNATSAVKRSVFLDDLVYSIAGDRAKVQRLDHLGADVAELSLLP